MLSMCMRSLSSSESSLSGNTGSCLSMSCRVSLACAATSPGALAQLLWGDSPTGGREGGPAPKLCAECWRKKPCVHGHLGMTGLTARLA